MSEHPVLQCSWASIKCYPCPACLPAPQHFRHSQMFEVFMTERLGMVARGELDRDSFEAKVRTEGGKRPLCSFCKTSVLERLLVCGREEKSNRPGLPPILVQVTQLMSKQALFGGISGAGLPGGQPAGGGRFSSFMRKTANAMRVRCGFLYGRFCPWEGISGGAILCKLVEGHGAAAEPAPHFLPPCSNPATA